MDLDSPPRESTRPTGWVLAVDFGTSNTGAAARFADGRVEKIALGSGSDTMPSAVVLTGKDWRVGQAALNARRTDPATFVGAPKARLGQEPAVFGDELVSPAQIVAQVLRVVRERAVRAAGGTDPDRVILTHPVDWGQARLDALCEAAVLAGFGAEHVWLLPEPVAAIHAPPAPAALPTGSRVAVVDIGGGTCDVAVLETTDAGPVVVAQTGDDRLGGNDLDDLLYRWVTDRLVTSGQSQIVAALDEPENLGAALTLLDVVRAAKQDLSEYPTAPVGVQVAGHDTVVTVSRDEYETLIAPAMAQAAELLTRALHDSGTTTLARLHLTGGTAYTPALARALHQVTGIIAEPLGDPKMAVATGALRTPDALATPAVRPAAEPGPAAPAAPVEPAVTLLGGRYELGKVIGHGGMAEVHLGRDQLLGRQVAIKVPHLSLARDPAFRRRFQREAKLAGKLNHPSIVRIYDADEVDLTGPTGGCVRTPFIVMERVVGHPLPDLMPGRQPLSVDRALSIAADVLAALELAHQAGVVHRDIKPANVMVTRAGTVKVMDFGIARSVAETGTTTTEGVIGTAAYLSPEQALGQRVDTRSDLYSVGCLLFEMLTGRPPFVGDSTVAVAYSHVNDPPPRPSSLDPRLPAVLDEVLAKALAKDRDARYSSADAFRADLDAIRRDPTTRPPGLAGAPGGTPTTVLPPAGLGAALPGAALPPSVPPQPRPLVHAAPQPRPLPPPQRPPSAAPPRAAAPRPSASTRRPAPKPRSAGPVVAAVAVVVVLAGVGAWGLVQDRWPWAASAAGSTTPAGPVSTTTTSPVVTPMTTPTPTVSSEPVDDPGPLVAGDCWTDGSEPSSKAPKLDAYVTSVVASSELAPVGSNTYFATNVLDGRLETAWTEGIAGDGEGEWLEVRFDRPVTVTELGVFNGYQKSPSLLADNGWPTCLQVTVDGEPPPTVIQRMSATYGAFEAIVWPLDLQHPTTTLRISIVSAVPGEKYHDTTISEIYILGHPS